MFLDNGSRMCDFQWLQEEVAGELCALNDTQFNSLADELQDQLPLVLAL